MMARTDFFVPVFFALSGFLLWRRHRADFSLPVRASSWGSFAGYYVKRLGRIFPAYLVLVVAVLLFFPVAGAPGWRAVLANLAMVQIYVPWGLVGGLTHLWSLCVEMAFYLALPFIAVALGRSPRRRRMLVIAVVAVLSFSWAFLPGMETPTAPGQINPHVMPPAFTAWFAVGLLAAELEEAIIDATPGDPRNLSTRYALPVVRRVEALRPVFVLIALAALTLAATDGPEGLESASPAEFARRTFFGLIFAAALVMPYAIAPRSRFLESRLMQALGRWSYGIFLWHIAVLSVVFPLLGIGLFQGHTALVLIATFVLTVPVAALSYALVEEPSRRAIASWWHATQHARSTR